MKIPPKDRPEWLQIVNQEIDYKFKNFVLQMKSAEFSKKIKDGSISQTQAVDEIYSLCEKYALAVTIDLQNIFKTY